MAAQPPPELNEIFSSCEELLAEAKGATDVEIKQAKIKEASMLCREGKRIVRDMEKNEDKDEDNAIFEKDRHIMARKLNFYISELKALKQKSVVEALSSIDNEPSAHSTIVQGECDNSLNEATSIRQRQAQMTKEQVMEEGRKVLSQTDELLNKQRRIVQDTVQIASTTAETLHTQTEQLSKVDEDLEQIRYSLKGSKKLIVSMTRGVATNKITSCLLLLIVLAVIGVIVVNVIDGDDEESPTEEEAAR